VDIHPKENDGSPSVREYRKIQIPPDLVVKLQLTDITDIILCPIKRPNSVHVACSVRRSRGELLSTAESQWFTTKSAGM
jgi:hypothetical protein